MNKQLLSAGILTLALVPSCSQKTKQKHPNLLLVFPDQMRVQTLGFLGQEPAITPNLDRFARQGLFFSNAASNTPVCSPYRGMLMTGMYSISNGVVNNTTSRAGEFSIQLRESDRTWSDVLHDQGYSLGYIGKWHLEYPHKPYIDCSNNRGKIKWNEWCPPERRHGFDFWYSYNTYDHHLHPMYWSTNAARDEFHYVNQWGPEHEADMAIKYLKNEDGSYRTPGKPFALVVSMNPPHMPYNQVPKRYVRMYDNKEEAIQKLFDDPRVPDTTDRWGKYYRKNIKNQLAMVTGVDEQFGRILSALEEIGLEKNTIVVFTSDHGDCLGKHGMISKSNPYEESMRIPLIIRWPDKIKPGTNDLLISVPDYYPTLLDLMGFRNQIPPQVEGVSYANICRGRKMPPHQQRPTSQLYFMLKGQISGKLPGDYFDHQNYGERGVRTNRYTMDVIKIFPDSSVTYLWDRQNDPMELHNIAPEHPELVRELFDKELKYWLQKTQDPWLKTTVKNFPPAK
ncbi:MAG: sulfatase [Bacteroidales bacterium]|nr:sulfatase [Bacteroidales bacterium]